MIAASLLTTLAFLAALAITRKSADEASPVEHVVATSVVMNAILGGAIYVLGITNILYRSVLGIVVSIISVGLLVAAYRRGVSPRALLLSWRDVLLLPLRAAWATARTASFTSVGLLFAFWFLVWTALAVVLAPNWRDWDALWYHESMVGFTIQNHGFRIVDLPVSLQKINGYQRFGEMTQLWFAIWAGRPIVEAANLVFTPMLMGAVYLLTKRYTRDRVTSIAWAVAFLLVPGNARLLQSTMVDPHAAALFVAAVYYASEERFTPRSAWLAIAALTMAVGTKTFLLIPGFVLAVCVLVRLAANRKELGTKVTVSTIAGGTALLVGMIAFTHLRNYIHFKNPVWPDLTVDLPSLGIHWQGTSVFFDSKLPTTQRVNANIGLSALYDHIVAMPWTVSWGDHSWQIADYGPGASWFAVPAGLVVCVVLVGVVLNDLRARRRSEAPSVEKRRTRARLALVLALPALAAYAASPAVYIGRYHTALVGLLFGVLAWAGSHPRRRRFAEGLPLFLQLTAIMMTLWTPPARRWWLGWDAMNELVRTPYPARELTQRFGSGVHEATGRYREREVRAGDVVGFDGLSFVSLLWNNAYSNHVVWLGNDPNPLAKAERLGMKWLYAGNGTTLRNQVIASPDWAPVGPLEAEQFGVTYRRR